MAGLLAGTMNGESQERLLTGTYEPLAGAWQNQPLAPRIAEVASGSFTKKQPPAIRGSGYVVASMEAALWAFHKSNSFEQAVLSAVNLGDDADTTGAICGQMAGAFYGIDGIPQRWLSVLWNAPADAISL
jgi:ADP-ribosylglycohydrolase